jgi:DNA-binding YbaB/EbfC family protein
VNINNIMKQAQKMQAGMARVQEELKDERVEASAGGGTVKVVMSGDLQVVSVTVDPAAVDPEDVDLLQDMITAAVNEGIRMAQEIASQKMAAVTGGMNVPGMGL